MKYLRIALISTLLLISTIACQDNKTKAMPDLVITSLEIDGMTSDSISYKYIITNQGTAPADLDGPKSKNTDNVSIQAVLSQDTDFDINQDSPAGGSILGTSPLGKLQPGQSRTGSFKSTTKTDPATQKYLILMVDYGDSVKETDENNNILAIPIQTH